MSDLDYEALAAWADAAASRVANSAASVMLSQQATAIREVAGLRAEVERLRSAAGYQAEAHTLRTSQKLLAELVRSWGYENKPNESNGSLIRRVLEDQRRQIKEDGDAIVAVASALGAPHYGAAEIVAEADTLRARVAELEGVLRPFADAAEELSRRHPDRTSIWEAPAASSIDAIHLRAARAALQTSAPLTPDDLAWAEEQIAMLATPPEDAR